MVATERDVAQLLDQLQRAEADECLDVMRENLVLLTPMVDAPLAALAADAERRKDDYLQRRVAATKELLTWGRGAGPTAFLANLNGTEPVSPNVPSTEFFDLFLATGEPAFLDAAVELLERDESDVPPGSGEPRAFVMYDLSVTLSARAAARGDTDDGNRAVAAAGESVSATPEGSPAMAVRLCNYARALVARFGWNHDPDDLDRAVDAGGRSVLLEGRGRADRLKCNVVYADALAKRYEATRSLDDLHAAISAARQALNSAEVGSAEHRGVQALMAHVLKLQARDARDRG
jgi:hypothetical protein